MFVNGFSLKHFSSLSNIEKFKSPVGNYLFPYPYAIDVTKNTYMLIEDVIMSNALSGEISLCDDVYNYYYDKCNIINEFDDSFHEVGIYFDNLKYYLLERENGIESNFDGKYRYTLKYDPFAKNYHSEYNPCIVFDNGIILNLSLDEYKKIMERFAIQRDLIPLLMTEE
jgi:hypothetical protein